MVIYICDYCKYETKRKWHYDKHLESNKHKQAVKLQENNDSSSDTNKEAIKSKPIVMDNNSEFVCPGCDKSFKNRVGLWRHKKTCSDFQSLQTEPEVVQATAVESDIDKVLELKKVELELEKTKLQVKQAELIHQNTEKMAGIATAAIEKSSVTNNTVNNTVNNNFNLKVYLNNDCKNAMNLTDFVESIKYQLEDLERFGRDGYVEGVSHVLIKALQDLDETQRPIHCTDTKRDSLYIKDNDEWQKDNSKTKIKKAIKNVAHKNMMNVSNWKKMYPQHDNIESNKHKEYIKMVNEVSGGATETEDEKNFKKIIHKVAVETVLDKDDKDMGNDIKEV